MPPSSLRYCKLSVKGFANAFLDSWRRISMHRHTKGQGAAAQEQRLFQAHEKETGHSDSQIRRASPSLSLLLESSGHERLHRTVLPGVIPYGDPSLLATFRQEATNGGTNMRASFRGANMKRTTNSGGKERKKKKKASSWEREASKEDEKRKVQARFLPQRTHRQVQGLARYPLLLLVYKSA